MVPSMVVFGSEVPEDWLKPTLFSTFLFLTFLRSSQGKLADSFLQRVRNDALLLSIPESRIPAANLKSERLT